jgi:hypothetical protein
MTKKKRLDAPSAPVKLKQTKESSMWKGNPAPLSPKQRAELEEADNWAILRASRPRGTIDRFLGLFAGKTKKVASIEEMSEAAAAGWADGCKKRPGSPGRL